MKKNLILTALVACFLVLSMAATSEAQSYLINYTHSAGYPAVYGISFNSGANYGTYYGSYMANVTITDPNPPNPYYWPSANYLAWCVSPQTANPVTGGELRVLYGDINLKKADWLIWNYARTAELQAAVWETAIDGGTGLGVGIFQMRTTSTNYSATSAILATLNSLTIDWNSYIPLTGHITDALAPAGDLWQDFLIKPEHPIPEPGSLLLLGTGLLGFSLISRYRRNKKA